MNKKELVLAIRQIVREEVNKELTKQLKDIQPGIVQAFENAITEVVDAFEDKLLMAESLTPRKVVKGTGKVVKKTKRIGTAIIDEDAPALTNGVEWNTGNPLLDEVLSSTTKTIPQGDGPGVLQEAIGSSSVLDNHDIPEHVQQALTRDYSDLMKTIDKKKQGVA